MKRGVSLIIAAGGRGTRFHKGRKSKDGLGKIFQPLAGKPLLAHALDSFRGFPQIREIVMAVPRETESWIKKNILAKRRDGSVRLVQGGETRAASVLNALKKTSSQSEWIAVHDGARPFPPKEALAELFQKTHEADAVILARPVVATLKRVRPGNGEVVETVDRSSLYEAETPQLVRRSCLLKAYENQNALAATDESSLIESVGGRVKVLSHSGWNVKVTTPEDLQLAEMYYRRGDAAKKDAVKIGFGKDTHRLVKGRKFYLGGVRIPYKLGALGHSDGDALLHAVTDALLGASALGDIGEWFPDKDPRNKNIRSEKILKKVLERIHKKGWTPAQVDTVIILEKPKLGLFKKKIKLSLQKLLKLDGESVSVKAKTMEGLGPEGEGLAVTCEAVTVLAPTRPSPLSSPWGRGGRRGG